MKKILFILLVLSTYNTNAQKVMKLSDANKTINRDSLTQVYFDRIFTEEITECFDVSQEFFLTEWSKFGRKIAKYFHEKQFGWGKATTATIEIYFNKDKGIDYFFIQIRDPEFTQERYDKVIAILTEFCKENKFTIEPKIPFTNSGSITFYD